MVLVPVVVVVVVVVPAGVLVVVVLLLLPAAGAREASGTYGSRPGAGRNVIRWYGVPIPDSAIVRIDAYRFS